MAATTHKLVGKVRPYFGRPRIESEPADEAITQSPQIAESPALPKVETSERQRNLAAAPAAVVPTKPVTPQPAVPALPDARSVVREACKPARWTVMELGDEYQIDVPVGAGRTQIVSVDFGRRDADARPLIVFTSMCGPVDAANALPLLRYNAKLTYGSLAIERRGNREEILVMRAIVPAASTTAPLLRTIIEEIARRADKIEGKLTGGDHY